MTAGHRVLLAVADEPASAGPAATALASLRTHGDWLNEMGWHLTVRSYAEVLAGLPSAPAGALCLLHFPYTYWDGWIEGHIPDVYGTGRYGTLLRDYLLTAGSALRRAIPDGLRYVNTPEAIAITRDKIELKKRLAAAGVPTPRAFPVRSPADLTLLLAAGYHLYVKAAHASVSKGIAVLSAERWQTNYSFDGQRLGPGQAGTGEGWRFHDIRTGHQAFLAALCGCPGFLVEEAAAWHGLRTELRVTVVRGRILAAEVWSAPAAAATTGPAEGGQRVSYLTGDELRDLPQGAASVARSAMTALGLGYAVHDIVVDRARGPLVIDVQGFPALGTSPGLFGELLALLIAGEKTVKPGPPADP